jgi:hypothetical protein
MLPGTHRPALPPQRRAISFLFPGGRNAILCAQVPPYATTCRIICKDVSDLVRYRTVDLWSHLRPEYPTRCAETTPDPREEPVMRGVEWMTTPGKRVMIQTPRARLLLAVGGPSGSRSRWGETWIALGAPGDVGTYVERFNAAAASEAHDRGGLAALAGR